MADSSNPKVTEVSDEFIHVAGDATTGTEGIKPKPVILIFGPKKMVRVPIKEIQSADDPFKLISDKAAEAKPEMTERNIFVVGAEKGFLQLTNNHELKSFLDDPQVAKRRGPRRILVAESLEKLQERRRLFRAANQQKRQKHPGKAAEKPSEKSDEEQSPKQNGGRRPMKELRNLLQKLRDQEIDKKSARKAYRKLVAEHELMEDLSPKAKLMLRIQNRLNRAEKPEDSSDEGGDAVETTEKQQ